MSDGNFPAVSSLVSLFSFNGMVEVDESISSPKPVFRQGPAFQRKLVSGSTELLGPGSQGGQSMHEHEGEHDPSVWLQHGMNIVVLTYSGKPVYTRFGSEDLIAGLSGTLQALVSKFSSLSLCGESDSLRSISVGETRIEFLDRSPLILVCVSRRKSVCSESIRRMLAALHAQLIFILTGGVNRTLQEHTNFDVRTLLGGTRPVLGNLVSWMHHEMLLSIQDSAIEPLPLPFPIRSGISSLMHRNLPSCALASYMFFEHRLVAVGTPTGGAASLISAGDLVLLVNLVVSSQSMRSSESWTPICLPSLSEECFVYAYVRFLSDELIYVSVSLSPDNANFYTISQHSEQVHSALFASSDELKDLNEWGSKCPIIIESIDREGSPEKQKALSKVRHCAIVLNQSRQFFSSRVSPGPQPSPPMGRQHKQIFNNYENCISLLGPITPNSPTSQQASITVGNDFVFVWITSEFQFFLTAPAGIDISVVTFVYQWMRDNEKTLFLPNLETSGHSGTRLNHKAPSLW